MPLGLDLVTGPGRNPSQLTPLSFKPSSAPDIYKFGQARLGPSLGV